MRLFLLLVLSLYNIVVVAIQPNFADCINGLRSGNFGWVVPGAVDTAGNPVSNASHATGLTYKTCLQICGSGREAFDWRTFSQQFTTWFLPWLPLMSQLPYGAKDPLSNSLALILMVGSPALAAYSLALAVTGNRWMVKRFTWSTLPHSSLAAQILGNLQQAHVHLPQEEYVLPSLIFLRENVGWWQTLAIGLDYPVPKWTVTAIMSVLYLLLTDGFSWVTALKSILDYTYVNAAGEGFGTLWLGLLPIVVCYLQLAPRSDSDRIGRAIDQANRRFYIVNDEGEVKQGDPSLGLYIEKVPKDPVREDETSSAPVFFYARFLTWMHLARVLTNGFDAASQHRSRRRSEIVECCRLRDNDHGQYSYEVFSIFFRSAILALFLQWGTTCASILVIYLTPTKGLGCRSMSTLLYGLVATLVWLFCVISSILSYYYVRSETRTNTVKFIGSLSIAIRHLAKTLAAINAVWLFLQSLLQFGSVYDTCYCNSSVFTLGKHAYAVLHLGQDDASALKLAWTGGLIMSSLTAILFVIALNLLRKRPELRSSALEMVDMGTT